MSGRTIGTIAGAVIGFVLSGYNPQGAYWGAMIGGMAGGLIDPETLQGAQFSGRSIAGSESGLARAIVFGTTVVEGRLMDGEDEPRLGTRKESAGKGGPEIEHDTALLSYAIEICESSELRDTLVQGVIAVWEDEKLVYDARPGSLISPADNAKWKENKTFYFGNEGQAPSAMLESIHGVGNVPAYVGTCRMDVADEDLVLHGERIPRYRFLVSKCGVEEDVYAMERVEWDPETVNDPAAGDVIVLGGFNLIFEGTANSPAGNVTADTFVSAGDWYWETTTGWMLRSSSGINHFGWSGIIRQSDGATAGVLRHNGTDGEAQGDLMTGSILLYPDWVPTAPEDPRFEIVRNRLTFTAGMAKWSVAIGAGSWVEILNAAGTFAPYGTSRGTYLDPNVYEKRVIIYSVPDDFTYGVPEGSLPLGVAKAGFDFASGMPIPDSPGQYIDPITGETVGPQDIGEVCGTTLAEIVRACYRLGAPQLTDDMLDLDVLDGTAVMGYAVSDIGATAADAIEPLRRTYLFDLPEYDAKIHARFRGGGTDWDIDPDNTIPGDESTLEGKRGLETAYPRRLQLTYVAPSIDYKPTTQTAENQNPDVWTDSDESYQVGIVLGDDEAAQVADIMLKVMTTEREDEQKFSLPIEYVGMVASDILTIEGKRYRVDQMRTEPNRVVIERAVYDRASAYSSEAVGVEGIAPPPPVSSVRGPTAFAVMNAPVLRDEDDKAGVYVAAAGLARGWKGAIIQASRDGVTFENGPQATVSATIGELTAELPAHSCYAQDWTNTLAVTLYPLSGELDSVTHEQIIAGANVAAIVYPSGKVEIIQFQTATEIAPRQYELTGIMRGRKDTAPGTHAAGATFVLLDNNVRFVAIKPDDLGKTLTFRCPSLGTDPDANETQAITFDTIESLREWKPYNIVVTPDGSGGFCVAWIVRARLGTSRTPVHSQWFDGCEVKFEVGTATYIVTTSDQYVCVSAETLAAAFPSGYGTPVVTVRARSRVATNDDDFDSPPGGQTGGYDGSEAFALSGTIPGGYVGIPYDLRNGDAGITIGGGYWEAQAFGEICPGVGAYGQFPLSSTYRSIGIPTTAGTYTATIYADSSSPVPGHAGTGTITNSVTIAAKPTYSMIDMRSRNTTRNTLVATTPPWSTFDVEAVSLYSYGFTAGKCRGEFTITNSDVALLVGVNAAYGDLAEGFRIGVQDGAPNQDAVLTTGDGTYAVEYDAATGNWEIFKAGTGSIATGNVPLPPGNQARIVCRPMSTDVVRVKANFGNETWVITPSSGYGGIPMPTVTLPCAVGDHGTDTDIMRLGSGYIGATSGTNPRVINHTFGTLGKSSGRWRIGISGATWCGLAVATYDSADGHLGASGTANSIGFNGTTLHWCFGGVHSSVSPTIPSATYRQIVFAPNFTASTVIVLVEDFDGTQTPIHTITGLPAGTWFPAESGSARIFTFTHNPAGPDGFTDWTTTV